MEAKIWGEVAIFKFLPVRVEMRLQEGNGIRKLGRLDSAQKEPTAGSIIVVEVLFGLEAEEEEIFLGEREDVQDLRPNRGLNRSHRVKPGDREFKDAPEEIVSISCVISNGSDGCAYLWRQGGGSQPWQEFQESFTHRGIPEEAKTRRAQALKAIQEDNGVKGHEGDEVVQADFLGTIVEDYHFLHPQRVQLRENFDVFREDRGDLWTHSVRVVVVPEVAHLLVDHYDVVETHDDVLHGGFDNAIATVLDELFIEIINTIHAVVVFYGCKFHHVKTTSTQCAGMHSPVTVSRGNDCPPPNRGIVSGVVLISIATEVEGVVTITISVATKSAIIITVDVNSTTKERFTNGRLAVPIGGLGGGRRMWCNTSSGRGVH